MKREQYTALLVIMASLALSFIHCPWFSIFYDDKEIFKYAGRVIQKGGVPYIDFFDHKPPLIFFLNYAGLIFGCWGLWMLDNLMILTGTMIFFNSCKKKMTLPWLLPILFNLMIRNPFISNGIGMTREYTTILILIYFCLMQDKIKYKYSLLGLITGLIFFMQQDQILTLLPFLFYSLIAEMDSPWIPGTLKRIGSLSGGFLLICIPILIYFLSHKGLYYFWNEAFQFNFEWYAERIPINKHVRPIFRTMREAGYDLVFYVSIVVGIASLILGNKKKMLLLSSLLAIFLSFGAEYISGKLAFGLAVSYYLLPLACTLPVLLFCVFSYTESPHFTAKTQQLVYVCICALPLLANMGGYTAHLLPRKENWFESRPETLYFKNLQLSNYDLYIFNSSNAVYLYNQHDILAPSKWIYHYFWHWYKNWDPNHEILESITKDLMSHKTTYVLDYSDSTTFKNKDNYQFWKRFLESHYASTSLDSGRVHVWKMK